MSKIEIKNVYKIFGDQPSKVLPMVQDGATKEEVLEKTGHTIGLDNVSLSTRGIATRTTQGGEGFPFLGDIGFSNVARYGESVSTSNLSIGQIILLIPRSSPCSLYTCRASVSCCIVHAIDESKVPALVL